GGHVPAGLVARDGGDARAPGGRVLAAVVLGPDEGGIGGFVAGRGVGDFVTGRGVGKGAPTGAGVGARVVVARFLPLAHAPRGETCEPGASENGQADGRSCGARPRAGTGVTGARAGAEITRLGG